MFRRIGTLREQRRERRSLKVGVGARRAQVKTRPSRRLVQFGGFGRSGAWPRRTEQRRFDGGEIAPNDGSGRGRLRAVFGRGFDRALAALVGERNELCERRALRGRRCFSPADAPFALVELDQRPPVRHRLAHVLTPYKCRLAERLAPQQLKLRHNG